MPFAAANSTVTVCAATRDRTCRIPDGSQVAPTVRFATRTIRWSVHNSVGNPPCLGPSVSMWTSFFAWASLSSVGRPEMALASSAALPRRCYFDDRVIGTSGDEAMKKAGYQWAVTETRLLAFAEPLPTPAAGSNAANAMARAALPCSTTCRARAEKVDDVPVGVRSVVAMTVT